MAESSTKKPDIIIPFGWKRSVSQDTVTSSACVTYVSPSGTMISSIAEVCRYLENNATCKCGLQCPLHVPKIFSFNPQVRGRNMTKKEWSRQEKPSAKKKTCLHWKKINNKYLAKRPKSTSQPVTEPPTKLIIIRKGGQLTSVIPDKDLKKKSADLSKAERQGKQNGKPVKRPTINTCKGETSKDVTGLTSAISPLKSPLFETASTSKISWPSGDGKTKSEFKLQWIKADDETSHNDTESGNELCFSPDKKSPLPSFPQSLLSSMGSPPMSQQKHNQLGGFPGMKNPNRPFFSPPSSTSMPMPTLGMGVEPVHRFGMSAFPRSNFIMKNEPGFDGNMGGHQFPQQHNVHPPAYPQMVMKSEKEQQMSVASPYPLPTLSSGKLYPPRANMRPDMPLRHPQTSVQWAQGTISSVQPGFNKNQANMWKGQDGSFMRGNIMVSPPGPRTQMQAMHDISPVMRPGTPQHVPNQQFSMRSPPACNPTSPYNYPTTASMGQGPFFGTSPGHRAAPSPFNNRPHSRSSSMGTPAPSPVPMGQWQGPRSGFASDNSRPHSRSSNVATPASPSPMPQWNSLGQQGMAFPVRAPGGGKNFIMDQSPGPMSPFSPIRQRFSQHQQFSNYPQNTMGSQMDMSNQRQLTGPAVHGHHRLPSQQQFGIVGQNVRPIRQEGLMSPRLPVNQKFESNLHPGVDPNMFRQQPPRYPTSSSFPMQDPSMRGKTFTFPTIDNTGPMPRMQSQPPMSMQAQWTTFHHNMGPGQFPRGTMFNRPPGMSRMKSPPLRPTGPQRMTSARATTPKPKRTRRKSSKAVTTAPQIKNLPTLTSNFMSNEFPDFFGQAHTGITSYQLQGLMQFKPSQNQVGAISQAPQQYLMNPNKITSTTLGSPMVPTEIMNILPTTPNLIIPPELDLPQSSKFSKSESYTSYPSPVISPIAPTLLSPTSNDPDVDEASNSSSKITSESKGNGDEKLKKRGAESGVITPPLPLLSPNLSFETDEDDFSDFASPVPTVFDFSTTAFTPNLVTPIPISISTKPIAMGQAFSCHSVPSSNVITTLHCNNVDISSSGQGPTTGKVTAIKNMTSHMGTFVISSSLSDTTTSKTFSCIDLKRSNNKPSFVHPPLLSSAACTSLVSSTGKIFHIPGGIHQKNPTSRRYSANSSSSSGKTRSERRRYASDPYPTVRSTKSEIPSVASWSNLGANKHQDAPSSTSLILASQKDPSKNLDASMLSSASYSTNSSCVISNPLMQEPNATIKVQAPPIATTLAQTDIDLKQSLNLPNLESLSTDLTLATSVCQNLPVLSAFHEETMGESKLLNERTGDLSKSTEKLIPPCSSNTTQQHSSIGEVKPFYTETIQLPSHYKIINSAIPSCKEVDNVEQNLTPTAYITSQDKFCEKMVEVTPLVTTSSEAEEMKKKLPNIHRSEPTTTMSSKAAGESSAMTTNEVNKLKEKENLELPEPTEKIRITENPKNNYDSVVLPINNDTLQILPCSDVKDIPQETSDLVKPELVKSEETDLTENISIAQVTSQENTRSISPPAEMENRSETYDAELRKSADSDKPECIIDDEKPLDAKEPEPIAESQTLVSTSEYVSSSKVQPICETQNASGSIQTNFTENKEEEKTSPGTNVDSIELSAQAPKCEEIDIGEQPGTTKLSLTQLERNIHTTDCDNMKQEESKTPCAITVLSTNKVAEYLGQESPDEGQKHSNKEVQQTLPSIATKSETESCVPHFEISNENDITLEEKNTSKPISSELEASESIIGKVLSVCKKENEEESNIPFSIPHQENKKKMESSENPTVTKEKSDFSGKEEDVIIHTVSKITTNVKVETTAEKCPQKTNIESLNEDSIMEVKEEPLIDKSEIKDGHLHGTTANQMAIVSSATTTAPLLGIPQDLTDTVIRQLSNYNTILKNLLVSGVGPVNPTLLTQLGSNPKSLNEQQKKMLSALTNPMQFRPTPAAASVSPAMLLFQDSSFPPGSVLSTSTSGSATASTSRGISDVSTCSNNINIDHFQSTNEKLDDNKSEQSRDQQLGIQSDASSCSSSLVLKTSQNLSLKHSDDTSKEIEVPHFVPTSSAGANSPQLPSTSGTHYSDVPDSRRATSNKVPATHQGLQVPIVSSSVKGTHAEEENSGIESQQENDSIVTVQDEVSTSQPAHDAVIPAESTATKTHPDQHKATENVADVESTILAKVKRGRGRPCKTRNSSKQNLKQPAMAASAVNAAKRTPAFSSTSTLSNLRHRGSSSNEKTRTPVKSGDLVWGQMRGFPSWPGKIVKPTEVRGLHQRQPLPDGKVWVKWFGDHTFTQMNPTDLRSMTEGLEAHHRSRKKGRTRNRKISIHLETAIQEAVDELEQQQDHRQVSPVKKTPVLVPDVQSTPTHDHPTPPEPTKPRSRGRKRKAT